jgi:hypothetical protein
VKTRLPQMWRGNTTDKNTIIVTSLRGALYPWYCHAIRGHNPYSFVKQPVGYKRRARESFVAHLLRSITRYKIFHRSPAAPPAAAIHTGRQYNISHVRHANPVMQLRQTIQSPRYMNATHISRIPWITTR